MKQAENWKRKYFWFHNVFDICYTRMILILEWYFFYWILDVLYFWYVTFILHCVELWHSFIKISFKCFSNLFSRGWWNIFSIKLILWLVFTLWPKSGLRVFENFLLSIISDRLIFSKVFFLTSFKDFNANVALFAVSLFGLRIFFL